MSVGVLLATKPLHDAAMQVVLALLSSLLRDTSLRETGSHPTSRLSMPGRCGGGKCER